jgi:hypothetical protein
MQHVKQSSCGGTAAHCIRFRIAHRHRALGRTGERTFVRTCQPYEGPEGSRRPVSVDPHERVAAGEKRVAASDAVSCARSFAIGTPPRFWGTGAGAQRSGVPWTRPVPWRSRPEGSDRRHRSVHAPERVLVVSRSHPLFVVRGVVLHGLRRCGGAAHFLRNFDGCRLPVERRLPGQFRTELPDVRRRGRSQPWAIFLGNRSETRRQPDSRQ